MTIKNINEDTCIGCGEFVMSCPMDVIRIDDETEKAKIIFPNDCQTCHLCEEFCSSPGTITVSPYKYDSPMMAWG